MNRSALRRWISFLQLIWTPREPEIRSRRQLPGIHPKPRH